MSIKQQGLLPRRRPERPRSWAVWPLLVTAQGWDPAIVQLTERLRASGVKQLTGAQSGPLQLGGSAGTRVPNKGKSVNYERCPGLTIQSPAPLTKPAGVGPLPPCPHPALSPGRLCGVQAGPRWGHATGVTGDARLMPAGLQRPASLFQSPAPVRPFGQPTRPVALRPAVGQGQGPGVVCSQELPLLRVGWGWVVGHPPCPEQPCRERATSSSWPWTW